MYVIDNIVSINNGQTDHLLGKISPSGLVEWIIRASDRQKLTERSTVPLNLDSCRAYRYDYIRRDNINTGVNDFYLVPEPAYTTGWRSETSTGVSDELRTDNDPALTSQV